MALRRPSKGQNNGISLRRMALTIFFTYMMLKSVETGTLTIKTTEDHEFFFQNQGQMVAFSSESHFVVSIGKSNF